MNLFSPFSLLCYFSCLFVLEASAPSQTYGSTPRRLTLICPSDFPLWSNSCPTGHGLICQHSCLLLLLLKLKPTLFKLTLSVLLYFCGLACSQPVRAVDCAQPYVKSSSSTGGIKALGRAVSEITLLFTLSLLPLQ